MGQRGRAGVVAACVVVVGLVLLGPLYLGTAPAAAQGCARPSDFPDSYEVTSRFTGQFRNVTLSDGSTVREPIFEPIPRGTTYNRLIVEVGRSVASPYDQDSRVGHPRRARLDDGTLEPGAYLETWSADANACLVAGPLAFVPDSVRFPGAPRSPTPAPTPIPTPTPSPAPPTASPSPAPAAAAPTATAVPTPNATPSPTSTPIPRPRNDIDLAASLPWLILVALAWIAGLVENRYDRRYRGA